MLSYQHGYHAGNMADVHKHALLALVLDYMVRKPKPVTYLETHSGRGIYDLTSAEAEKTGEAAAGILRVESRFAPDHPYLRALGAARAIGGPMAYPGSPAVARAFLREGDRMVLAEKHPAEAAGLRAAFPGAEVRETDGPQMALSLVPPTPRRGALLIDPSYEVKTEFDTIPRLFHNLRRKWPVGVVMLWYPILASGADAGLVSALGDPEEEVLHHRVRFAPARPGHGMIGSGMVIANPPWGLADAARALEPMID
ncbi:23S rRNA (adenine(2030)-N(6))-methyltransferase RlmJ [Arenibacterium halophilum]|uniref:Ribosomal RNA large subunit methyltransferase J n=1 Tax=Arenibacterium halophilum TaxID=2583821 RepID=A0ABY2X6V5_9RHOB|nr:23S rRNA (adenine(2030)-N(6))-methyltransferase RlmJ [Arenibacterium halophilum]TMV10828.1 23S rRNA (adenine(2030)-N(6))-methyltransferase RlmJ [Arenibacterium halophilum]